MLGLDNQARTKAAGLIQAARWCQTERTCSCSVGDGTACDHSAPSAGQWSGSPALASSRYSRDPVNAQSAPWSSNRAASPNMSRTPARLRRDSWQSSADPCGASRPTGKPEACEAGVAPPSRTTTCQPRLAREAATLAPANPAPITAHVPGGMTASMEGFRLFLSVQCGSNTAFWTSGFVLGLTTKPHCAKITVNFGSPCQRVTCVPRRQQRANALTAQISHAACPPCMPSPKTTSSAQKCCCLRSSTVLPIQRVNRTRPSSKLIR